MPTAVNRAPVAATTTGLSPQPLRIWGTCSRGKVSGQQFASFGNVNYGATCDAGLGKDLTFCQRGAGAAAYATATANVAQGGKWTAGPGSPTGAPANDNGMPDYGDQATGMENQSVIAGFGYAQWQKACGKQ